MVGGGAAHCLYRPRVLVQLPGLVAARRCGLRHGVAGGRVTDVFLTVSEARRRDARRLHIHRHAVAIGNGRDPALFQTRHRRPPADPCRAWRAGRIASWCSRCRGWCGTRAIPNWRRRCARCRTRNYGWQASGSPPIAVPTWLDCLRSAGLGERLRLLGYRDDVPALMAAADIFVLPSDFEGLPMSVIEAMLTGLPVVASERARPGGAGRCRK